VLVPPVVPPGVVVVPPVVPPGVVVVPPVVPPGVVVVPPVVPPPSVVPPGVVVVSPVVPPPSVVPPWLQADKAKGRMAKLRANALVQTVLDKLERFIVVVLLKVVNSCGFVNILVYKKWNVFSSFQDILIAYIRLCLKD
jgi:hypothetical protein